MNGHTTQFGPHQKIEKVNQKKVSIFKNKEYLDMHHLVLILCLFSVSLNIVLGFVKENPEISLIPRFDEKDLQALVLNILK